VSDAAPDQALFQALADPRRRRILEVLAAGRRDVGDLARRCELPRALVAHHLTVLERAELVTVRRRQAHVRPERLAALRRYYDEALTTAAISAPLR
jgi:DNA-binding transcriptional ArsR family regulator